MLPRCWRAPALSARSLALTDQRVALRRQHLKCNTVPVLVALSAVSASLLAASIGAAAGVLGGLVGQYFAAWLARRSRQEDRRIDDLIRLQDSLARLNRLHHRLVGHWRRGGESAHIPDELWEDWMATRAEALALNQRVVEDDLRAEVQGLRQLLGVQPNAEHLESLRAQINTQYEKVQDRLGDELRRGLT